MRNTVNKSKIRFFDSQSFFFLNATNVALDTILWMLSDFFCTAPKSVPKTSESSFENNLSITFPF